MFIIQDWVADLDIGPAEIRKFCSVDQTGTNLLKAAMQQMQLSACAYHYILKLARTIIDLAGPEHIQTAHAVERMHYSFGSPSLRWKRYHR